MTQFHYISINKSCQVKLDQAGFNCPLWLRECASRPPDGALSPSWIVPLGFSWCSCELSVLSEMLPVYYKSMPAEAKREREIFHSLINCLITSPNKFNEERATFVPAEDVSARCFSFSFHWRINHLHVIYRFLKVFMLVRAITKDI